MSGKGSKPRPFSVDQETFDNNWDRIFKKEKWDHYSDLPNPDAYKNDAGVLLGEDSAFQADEVGSNPITRSS